MGEGDLELKITPHYGKYNYDEGMEYALRATGLASPPIR
jgi:hypothetical protein